MTLSMKVLVLYDKYSTYTNAVYDHLASFSQYSDFKHYYAHALGGLRKIPLEKFDCVLVHYSIRVAFSAFSDRDVQRLKNYQGNKILFVQDEYDYTESVRGIIKRCKFDLVFTCVPPLSINDIYPESKFPKTRFVNTLTGYVNEDNAPAVHDFVRSIDIGYRGRELPFWYGDLGQEKRIIAEGILERASDSGISLDISCKDSERIYGDEWPRFLKSCKATLGTESGCNIFDDLGCIKSRILEYLDKYPNSRYSDVRRDVLYDVPQGEIMNQVSPRLFEAVQYGTVLILFEGKYSGVFKPWLHYIPLKKDFSNIDEVIEKVKDDLFLKGIAYNAYRDIIGAGSYTYKSFIGSYDEELKRFESQFTLFCPKRSKGKFPKIVTLYPERKPLIKVKGLYRRVWQFLPYGFKVKIKPIVINTSVAIKSFIRK